MADHAASTPERVADRQRAVRAVELRVAGADYRRIANELGYASEDTANRAVMRALARQETPALNDLRALEAERLDRLWMNALTILRRDQTPAALLAAVRVSERRARLLGLDAPTEVRVAEAVTHEDVVELRDQFMALRGAEVIEGEAE